MSLLQVSCAHEGASYQTIHELFEAQVEKTPDAVALVFEEQRLSYRELDARANQVAHALRAMGVGPEALVGLFLERSIELFVGMLGILKAGGAYVPLDPAYPRRRIEFITEDAKLSVLVTSGELSRGLLGHRARTLCFDADADLLARQPDTRIDAGAGAGSLAYVIYTSGSTGTPKGVLIEHRGVVSLAHSQIELFDVRPDSRVLQLSSICFDASVSEYLMAFAVGASLHLIREADKMPGPGLVSLMRQQEITHALLIPSTLAALPYDALPSLRVIVSAAEACPGALVDRWGVGRRFVNAYGPTETTVHATAFECIPGAGHPSIGYALPGIVAYILDEQLAPLPPGEVGEIHIGGISLARGYLDRPEITASRFVANPRAPGERLYKSGDTGRVLPGGAIEYVGRCDQQVKIRGFRVELGEIELTLRAHPSIREAAALAREDRAQHKRIEAFLVFEPGKRVDVRELRRFVGERLPEYMVPAVFVELQALPLAPSGKVNRNALPALEGARPEVSAAYVAPLNEGQRSICEVFAEVLGVDRVGAYDDFFELGGDSLLAVQIVARLSVLLGAPLGVRDIFEERTPARLSLRVEASRSGTIEPEVSSIPRAPRGAPLPLSSAESRLWFLHELEPESRAYHLPFAIRIEAPLDIGRMSEGLTEITRRHEPLRTTYVAASGRPSRRIAEPRSIHVPFIDLAILPERERDVELAAALSRAAKEPFDVEFGPLFRARLFRLGERSFVLFVMMHHLVADGRSMQIFLEELVALVDRPATLPELPIEYADFAAWQARRSAEQEAELDHWRRELEGRPLRSGLPANRRKAITSRKSERARFSLSPELVTQLRALAREEGASLFMALFAGFVAMLHRWTSQDDILVGTPTAGRARPELEGLIGFFANTLVLRSRVDRSTTLRSLLEQVRERALGAYAHADVPFDKVVEALSPRRAPGQNPLFDVMFALQAPLPDIDGASGARFSLSELDPGESPFDLLWQVWESDGPSEGLVGEVVYRVALLDRHEVARLIERYIALLEGMVAAPETNVFPNVDTEARPVVIDVELARRWEESLRLAPGISDVAVLVEEETEPLPRLHLLDLLGEESTSKGAPAVHAPRMQHDHHVEGRTLALADGGPLHLPPGEPATLVESLLRAARGDRGLSYIESSGARSTQRYHELLEEARAILGGLRLRGLGAGDRVILQLGSLRAHFTTFWACLLGGIVPVTVALAPSYDVPSGVTAKLFNVWKLLGRPVVLTSERLAGSLAGIRKLHPMEGLELLSIEGLSRETSNVEPHPCMPGDVAFLQLSSGSTGVPKCIQETHEGVIRHILAATKHNGYTSDDIALNWLPVDHVVPILTWHLRDVYLGCQQIQVATEHILGEPLRWLDLLAEMRVSQTWSPNFGFKLVADRLGRLAKGERTWDLSCVRSFMNAGEQVTLPVVREFLRLVSPFGVPNKAMQPSFGMAEVCTCMTYTNDFDVDRSVHWAARASLASEISFLSGESPAAVPFVDLGPPVPGVSIRITDSQNRVLPEGVIGRFQIKGGVVTPGYLDNEDANREAFVGEGWFNSGDLGFIRNGRLTITGREKEIIIVRGANLPCYEVEEIAGSVAGVVPTFVAATAIDDEKGGTEGLAIFFVSERKTIAAKASVARELRRVVTESFGVSPTHVVPVEREGFPKTTSGKIQRSALKRALMEGRFRQILREIDLHEGNRATIPRWFYRKTWQERAIERREPVARGCLVLGDSRELAEELRGILEAKGKRVMVAPTISAAEEAIAREPFGDIVHLGAEAGEEEALRFLAMIRAIESTRRERGETSMEARIVWISRRAQVVLPGDSIDPVRAIVLGLLQTATQEMPWLSCRHVDLGDESWNAEVIADELSHVGLEREIAYRRGARWVLVLEDASPSLLSSGSLACDFVTGGFYVIPGGLGGIGVHLASWLLEERGARVLLLGRSDASTRADILDKLAASARVGSGEVVYESVDIADPAELEAAVARSEARWGRAMDALVHLAALSRERMLGDETAEGLLSVIRPRLWGARAISALLERRPGAMFIAFSSVTGAFGGVSVGAYAAASRFMEHFALSLRQRGHTAMSLAFSFWEGIGMSRDGNMRQAAIASGYLPISAGEGINSLRAAMRSGEASLVVGLDGRHARILRYLAAAPREKRLGLHAYLVASGSADARASLEELSPLDGKASSGGLHVHEVERIPRDPAGNVDVSALHALDPARASRAPAHEAANGALETTIAAIWQRALRVDRVGVNDNFFDVGGHSLLLAEVRSSLERTLSREIAVTDLFDHPTIRALARHLEGAPEKPATSQAAERGSRQRAALALGRPRGAGKTQNG